MQLLQLLGLFIHHSPPAPSWRLPVDYLLCGRGCGSKFKNTAPLKRHEQVCTYTNARATQNIMGPVATCPQVPSVKEEPRFDNELMKNSSAPEPEPLRELNSEGGLRLKSSSTLLEYNDRK